MDTARRDFERKIYQECDEEDRREYQSAVEPLVRPIPFEDYVADCGNPECGWKGLASECVTPKHQLDEVLCPMCHDVTEPANEI